MKDLRRPWFHRTWRRSSLLPSGSEINHVDSDGTTGFCRNCRKTGIIFDTNVRLQTQTSVTDTAVVLLTKIYRINVTIKRFLFSVNAVKKVSGEWRVYCKVPLSVTELQWIIDAFGSSPTMDLLISGSVRDKLWIISSSSVSLLFNLCLNINWRQGTWDKKTMNCTLTTGLGEVSKTGDSNSNSLIYFPHFLIIN